MIKLKSLVKEAANDAIWYHGSGEPKQISDFLISCGIDGLRVMNDVRDDILVVFNDMIISKPKLLGNSNDSINKSSMGLGGGGRAAASHLDKKEKI